MQQPVSLPKQKTDVLVNDLIRSVYNWMVIGLALTGFVALYVASSETMLRLIFGNRLIFFGLIIAELGLVFSISGMVDKMSASTATALFVIYSALNGATLSIIFLAYTSGSIASTFLICSGTFLTCSLYGWITKRDLTSWGGFFMMGLVGIIIASVVNLFVRSDAVTMIVSYIGVFVFVGLTVYDTYRLKQMAMTLPDSTDGATVRKMSILGALSLYLNFINLFLMLLRIFGNSRD